MSENTKVDLWFDPSCPWAWMTSRWLMEVKKVRQINLEFHVMSLAVLNQGRDLEPEYRKHIDQTWQAARSCIGVETRYGQQTLSDYYTVLGTRIHLKQEGLGQDTIEKALQDLDLDPQIALDSTSDIYDEQMVKSHNAGMKPVGSDVGTPVIHINGMALFGPVISPAPKGEQAGELFDGFVKVCAYPGFFELKRSRTVGPIFD